MISMSDMEIYRQLVPRRGIQSSGNSSKQFNRKDKPRQTEMRIDGHPRLLLAAVLYFTIPAIPIAGAAPNLGTPTAEDYQIWSLALQDVIEDSSPEEIVITDET